MPFCRNVSSRKRKWLCTKSTQKQKHAASQVWTSLVRNSPRPVQHFTEPCSLYLNPHPLPLSSRETWSLFPQRGTFHQNKGTEGSSRAHAVSTWWKLPQELPTDFAEELGRAGGKASYIQGRGKSCSSAMRSGQSWTTSRPSPVWTWGSKDPHLDTSPLPQNNWKMCKSPENTEKRLHSFHTGKLPQIFP